MLQAAARHQDLATCVAASPCGRFLASGAPAVGTPLSFPENTFTLLALFLSSQEESDVVNIRAAKPASMKQGMEGCRTAADYALASASRLISEESVLQRFPSRVLCCLRAFEAPNVLASDFQIIRLHGLGQHRGLRQLVAALATRPKSHSRA